MCDVQLFHVAGCVLLGVYKGARLRSACARLTGGSYAAHAHMLHMACVSCSRPCCALRGTWKVRWQARQEARGNTSAVDVLLHGWTDIQPVCFAFQSSLML